MWLGCRPCGVVQIIYRISYRGCRLAKFWNFWPGAVNSWTVISDSWRRKLTVDALKV